MPRRCLAPLLVLLGVAVLCGPAPGQKADPKPDRKPAYFKVLVPQDNATVKFDDTQTKLTGTTRHFVSPPLEPGRRYSYTVTAFWEPNNYTKITRKREVVFKAGDTVDLDLTKQDEKFPDDVVIRFVPTPPDVVEQMLKLANVKEGEVVYDLGCGDGRIPIMAVEKFKAKRGVGIDIDPERIKEAKANAGKGPARDKLEFRQADVLKVDDYSEADVVTLYMGDDLNVAVRPLLLKSLKPGSRIVSHRFLMGDWKPDKSVVYSGQDGDEYHLHLWKVGAKKEGK